MRLRAWPCAILLAGAIPQTLAAQSPSEDADVTAAVFGAREGIEQISLSPDGSQVAYIAPSAGQGALLVVRGVQDEAQPRPIAMADGKPERLGRCGWVSNARLVCTAYGITEIVGRKTGFTRVFAIDADGKNLQVLSRKDNDYARGVQLGGGSVIDWLPEQDGSVLMTRNYLPDDHVGSRIGSAKEGLAVDQVDTRSGVVHAVESPRASATEYISDGRGTVRIMGLQETSGASEMMTGITHYLFRRPGSRTWERLSDVNSASILTRSIAI